MAAGLCARRVGSHGGDGCDCRGVDVPDCGGPLFAVAFAASGTCDSPGEERNVGRKRKGRYIIEWWIGDHEPRHVHVFDRSGKYLGRVILATMHGLERWQPPRDLIEILREMTREGEL